MSSANGFPHTQSEWTRRDVFLISGALVLLVMVTGALATRDQWAARVGALADIPSAIATLYTMDYHALAFDPLDSNVVYFGHHNGIMKSVDGGVHWTPILTQGDAMGLAMTEGAIVMAGHEVFMRSEDGGKSWKSIPTDLPDHDIHGFAVSPANPRLFFAYIVKYGLWRSEDAGATWKLTSKELPETVLSLAVVPTTPETIYAGTMDQGLLKSADGGKAFQAVKGFPSKAALGLAQDSRDPRIVYAGTGSGLVRSNAEGTAWTRLGLKDKNLMTTAVSRASPSRILAVDAQGRVYRSDDAGATWHGK